MTAAPPLEQPTVRYRAALATTSSEVDAARRLRHEVSALECGAGPGPGGVAPMRDVDMQDGHCDHLVVREERSGAVVGTIRLLSPERAVALGRFHAGGAFDLGRLAGLRAGLVEAGRGSLHPDHPADAVLAQLWAGVARYVRDGGYTHLGGSVSVPLADGGGAAAGLWDLLVRERRLAPAGLWTVPRVPFDVHAPARPDPPDLPPLITAYLGMGARACGRPAHDAEFGTAEFYLLLALTDIDQRVPRRLPTGTR